VTVPSSLDGLPVTVIGNGVESVLNMFNPITSLTIPGSVTSIAQSAFKTSVLTSVTISNGLTSIGDEAFEDCYDLTNVTMPETVTIIEYSAFNSCWHLTSITISGNVTAIGSEAFAYCTRLTNVTIPGSVSSIGSFPFYSCFSLTSVFFMGDAPAVDWSMFVSLDTVPPSYDPVTVYYLPGTTGWGDFISTTSVPAVLWNPSIQAIGIQSNQFSFTITGTANIPILVAASTNLANGIWTPVQFCTLTNGSIYFTDPAWTNYPGRFYKVFYP
jgi:hypothetical protein